MSTRCASTQLDVGNESPLWKVPGLFCDFKTPYHRIALSVKVVTLSEFAT